MRTPRSRPGAACAAATGIPLTHRDRARTVTFATGHTRDGKLDLDFAALARPGQTLAVYMGVTTLAALRDGLVAAGLPATVLADDGDAGLLAVVPATLVKGLEFDAVVVVDPAAIAAAEPRGLHRLYVVLTRAVSTLVVLHRDDLPAQLAAVPG